LVLVSNDKESLQEGLNFILSHFQRPVFARTISTYRTSNRQIEVFDIQTAIGFFEDAKFIDCKINAYPTYTEYKGINRQAPDFIFIDLDKSAFKSERALKLALNKTLRNIKEKLDDINSSSNPTVLWTGNGYHIYQSIDAFVLEQEELFSKFDKPSKTFLRFSERYLSDYRSDPSHNPSFKSSMTRIPGSYNSKCIKEKEGVTIEPSKVKIVQRWDGHRPKINLLLGSFYAYLVDQKIKELQSQKGNIPEYDSSCTTSSGRSSNGIIQWIERLLQTPIEDYRKNAVSLILAPYLINIRKLPDLAALDIIREWLDKCASLRPLDSNLSYRVKYDVNNAMKSRIPPMKFDTLKQKNRLLYDKLCGYT
jgi:hypothetical protein